MWLASEQAVKLRHLIREGPGFPSLYEDYVRHVKEYSKNEASEIWASFATAQLESLDAEGEALSQFNSLIEGLFIQHGFAWWQDNCETAGLPKLPARKGRTVSAIRRLLGLHEPYQLFQKSYQDPLFRLFSGSRPKIRLAGEAVGLANFALEAECSFGQFNELHFWPSKQYYRDIYLENWPAGIDEFLTKWTAELPLCQLGFARLGGCRASSNTDWMANIKRLELASCATGVLSQLLSTTASRVEAIKFSPLASSAGEQTEVMLKSPLCQQLAVLSFLLVDRSQIGKLPLLRNLSGLRTCRVRLRRPSSGSPDSRVALIDALAESLPDVKRRFDLDIAYDGGVSDFPDADIDEAVVRLAFRQPLNIWVKLHRPQGFHGYAHGFPEHAGRIEVVPNTGWWGD